LQLGRTGVDYSCKFRFLHEFGECLDAHTSLVGVQGAARNADLDRAGTGSSWSGDPGTATRAAWSLGSGEEITLASSVIFAILIVSLDRVGKRFPSGHLTAGYMLGTWLPAIVVALVSAAQGPGLYSWLDQVRKALAQPAIARDVILLTVFCSVLATYLFTVYQPRLTPARAALIYLLEPVFATCFSMTIGHDHLTARLALGGGFILLGNVIVEMPKLWREFRRPP